MKKPDEKLEAEIMEYIFSPQCPDHNKALAQWRKNPWEAVSMYEYAIYPHLLELPLAMPGKVKSRDEQMLKNDIDRFFGKVVYETSPRAPEGEYEVDGVMVRINKFGRVENPEDVWDDDQDNGEWN